MEVKTNNEIINEIEKMRDKYCQQEIKNGFIPSSQVLNVFSDILDLIRNNET